MSNHIDELTMDELEHQLALPARELMQTLSPPRRRMFVPVPAERHTGYSRPSVPSI